MAERNPGLDEVMSQRVLEEFAASTPVFVEAPPLRLWPTVAASTLAGSTAGVVAGALVSPLVAVAVVVGLAAAGTALAVAVVRES